MMVKVNDVMDTVKEIMEDSSLPKNIKSKLEEITNCLKSCSSKEVRLRADKCIHDLDEVSSDVNIQPFVRTQIWSLVSMLEALE
ncbi:UPF0147 family protein [Candidatus Woesearchaeota archaeon]|nr:UPF0147 family protein [Candidatus Woesearchaeota archaeon]